MRDESVGARTARAAAAPGIAFLAVTLIGLARVNDRSYWYDEAVTASIVRRPLGGLLTVILRREAGMADYFVGLFAWSKMFDSDGGLRMFSVVGAATAAALFVVVLRRATSTVVALAGAAVMVSNPFFLRYLTEARAYSWMMALGLAICVAALRLADENSTRRAVVLGLTIGLAAACHLAMWAVAAGAFVALLAASRRDRATLRSLGIAAAIGLVMFAPTVPVMLSRRDDQITWIADPSWSGADEVLKEWLGGRWWLLAVMAGVIVLIVDQALRRQIDVVASLAVCVAVLTPVLVVIVSMVDSLWIGRYLAGAFPLAIMCACLAADVIARRILAPVAARAQRPAADVVFACGALVVVLPFLTGGPLTDDLPLDGWDDAAAYLDANAQPGDAIVLRSFDVAIDHYLGYHPDLEPGLLEIPDNGHVYPTRRSPAEIDPLLPQGGRVFVVTNDVFAFDVAEFPSLASRPVEQVAFEHALIRVYAPTN